MTAALRQLTGPALEAELVRLTTAVGDRLSAEQHELLRLTEADLADAGDAVTLRWGQTSLLHVINASPVPAIEEEMVASVAAFLDNLPEAGGPEYQPIVVSVAIAIRTLVMEAGFVAGHAPIIHTLCRALTRWPLTGQLRWEVGGAIDCWSQATGIAADNPTGVWEILTGARLRGWKTPRTSWPAR